MNYFYKKKEQTETTFVFEWQKARIGKNYLRTAVVGSVVSALVFHYWCFFSEFEFIAHLFWAFPLGAISFLILYAFARETYSQDAFNTLMIFDNEIGQVVFVENSEKVISQFSYSQLEKICYQRIENKNKSGSVTSVVHYLDIILKDKKVYRIPSQSNPEKLSTWAEELNEFIDWSKGEILIPRNYRLPSGLKVTDIEDKVVLSYEPNVKPALVVNLLLLIPYVSFTLLTIINLGFLGWLLNIFYVIVNVIAVFVIFRPLIITLIDFFANRNCKYELILSSETFELIKKYDSGEIKKIVKCPIGEIKSVSSSFSPLYQCSLSFTPNIQESKEKVKTYKFLFGDIGKFELMEMEQYFQYQIGRFSGKDVF